MKFSKEHLKLLIEAIAKEITENEHLVFPYVGGGNVIDQDYLEDAIRAGLESV